MMATEDNGCIHNFTVQSHAGRDCFKCGVSREADMQRQRDELSEEMERCHAMLDAHYGEPEGTVSADTLGQRVAWLLEEVKGRAKTERFRFVSDDDGHAYLIPADKKQAFDRWLEHQERLWEPGLSEEEFRKREGEYSGEEFDGYRVDGQERYTFERPEVKK